MNQQINRKIAVSDQCCEGKKQGDMAERKARDFLSKLGRDKNMKSWPQHLRNDPQVFLAFIHYYLLNENEGCFWETV